MAKVRLTTITPLMVFLWLKVYGQEINRSPGAAINDILIHFLGTRYPLDRSPIGKELHNDNKQRQE